MKFSAANAEFHISNFNILLILPSQLFVSLAVIIFIMRKIFTLLLLSLASCQLNAQQSNSSLLIGSQVGISRLAPMKTRIPTFKLGVQSFSYSTSLENRLSIRKKLNFSLQYSLNYTHFRSVPSLSAKTPSKNVLSTSVSASSVYQIKSDLCVVTGVGIQKPFCLKPNSSQQKEILNTLLSKKADTRYSIKNLHQITPYFIIGFENSTKLFNKNLIYSLQYNVGFMPSKYRVIEEGSTENESNQGGVQIGLKYKY